MVLCPAAGVGSSLASMPTGGRFWYREEDESFEVLRAEALELALAFEKRTDFFSLRSTDAYFKVLNLFPPKVGVLDSMVPIVNWGY